MEKALHLERGVPRSFVFMSYVYYIDNRGKLSYSKDKGGDINGESSHDTQH